MGKNCKTCSYFRGFSLKTILPHKIQQGECHLDPPIVFQNPSLENPLGLGIIGKRPTVALDQYCSSWQLKNVRE